ncbi:hypothetical protein FHK92_19940 [Pseudomonas brassicacearum subsp. neoaurantiaca]|uniref:Uncharacterized protein n=1 Tax=Pseudomonas brassicacearum subsp. neoaurantiaca TaxID=494916 RepID=A0A7V8UEE2_9PSED|nr:hypothetical protein [Pseudomonas brassicacearum subsp. neoaurantiaca]
MTQHLRTPPIPVGASLLAKASVHSTCVLSDTPLSPAGSLPQQAPRKINQYATVPVGPRCRQDEDLQVRTQEADRDRSVYCRSNRRTSRGSSRGPA